MRNRGVLLVVAILAGCSSVTAPAGEHDYEGTILEVNQASVLVRALDDECGAWTLVHSGTYLEIRGSAAELSELRHGARARVWFQGAIQDSCPLGTTARALVVP